MNSQPAEIDRTVLLRVAEGDAKAAKDLLDLAGPLVFGFVFARVGGNREAAEDIVQATFLEAVRSASAFRGESRLGTWLCTIARRQIGRHYELERRQVVLESKMRLVAEPPRPPGQWDEPLARADATIAALGVLPALHRQVLVLKYLDEMTVGEIAGELSRSKVQVQSLLQRARAGLRQALDGATP